MAGPFGDLVSQFTSQDDTGIMETGGRTTRSGPEPFGMLDVLGIGSKARSQQRGYDEAERLRQQAQGKEQATNSAQSEILSDRHLVVAF